MVVVIQQCPFEGSRIFFNSFRNEWWFSGPEWLAKAVNTLQVGDPSMPHECANKMGKSRDPSDVLVRRLGQC